MAIYPSLDISWQANYKRKGKPVGFRNLGNTCYLNSVLQCLTYTPPLANFCLHGLHSKQCDNSNQNCPFCLLEQRIARSLFNDIEIDAPNRIYKCLQTFVKHFRPGRQEDAHELLRYAIDSCDNVCLQLQKRMKGSQTGQKEESWTVMKEIFGGYLQSQIRCSSCNAVSSKLDCVMDLSLEVVGLPTKTLDAAFRKFFQQEVLDGNNKYQCEKCKKLSTARKQMCIYEAPNVLVIHLKRFENFLGGKIDTHIEFQEKLKLGSYMSKKSRDVQPDYSLYGVVIHSGFTQYGGHYYAYVKDPRGQWYCCDDSSVTVAHSRTVLLEKAYILFYVRDHPKPSFSKENCISSASSTPSPPPTPDPVTVVKPLGDSNKVTVSKPSSEVKQQTTTTKQQPVKFFITKPDNRTNIRPHPKPKPDKPEAPHETIKAEVTSEEPVTKASSQNCVVDTRLECGDAEDSCKQFSVLSGVNDNVIDHEVKTSPRKRSYEERLKEYRDSTGHQDLMTRMESEARQALIKSGWCDELRESMRAVKRNQNFVSTNQTEAREILISEVRESLLRQVPVSIKGQLVSQLQEHYNAKIR